MKKLIIAFALTFVIISCSSDSESALQSNCNLIDCATGNLLLQFFDTETGEDVFFNGTYEYANLVITDLSTGEDFPFFTGTSDEAQASQIALNPFFESRNNVVLRITVPNGFETDLSFDVVYFEGECCNGNEYSNVAFTNVESVENPQGGFFYKVFL